MKKAILILTGTPDAKNRFDTVIKKSAWVWGINPNNHLSNIAKSLFWDGERNELFHKFLSDFRNLVNGAFAFDEKYVLSMVEKFLSDKDYKKHDKSGRDYERFILTIHGIPKSLYNRLEQDFGAFQIHLTSLFLIYFHFLLLLLLLQSVLFSFL